MRFITVCLILLLSGMSGGCRRAAPEEPQPVPIRIDLTSAAFSEGAPIPDRYSCAGGGMSPPLQWSRPPAGAQSLALVFEKQDPEQERPGTVLWLLFNLSPALMGLPEGGRPRQEPPPVVGLNHFGTLGYDGPCPSGGEVGRYVFRLLALDTMLPPEAGRSAPLFEGFVRAHVLAEGRLTGSYLFADP